MALPEIMTIEEVAEYLRVSERTVYDWSAKGEIPCDKIGTAWSFKRSEIESWVDRRPGGTSHSAASVLLPVTIDSVLTPEQTVILKNVTKADVLNELISVLATSPNVGNRDRLAAAVFRREEILSTAVGFGVAVPHVRLDCVKELSMAVGVSRKGVVDYQSVDDIPVHIVCMIAGAPEKHEQYLRLLAAICRKLQNKKGLSELLAAPDAVAVYNILTG